MFSFLNSALLFALIGVGIPVLIHFLGRQKRQKILFSSTSFLKELQSLKMRQIKIRQAILLILRCLAILLFVLAFARPTVKTERVLDHGQSRSSAVLIIDRSMSMKREDFFNQAQNAAVSVLDLLQNEDEAALVWTVPTSERESSFNRDRTNLHQDILAMEPSWGWGNVFKSIHDAISLLDHSNNINQEIYLISDMQANSFPSLNDSGHVKDWEGPFFIIPISHEIENVAIIGGGIEDQIIQPDTPLEVYAEIENGGRNAIEDLLVRIFIKDQVYAQKAIHLEAGERVRVSFQVTPEDVGWIWGSIQIDVDDFPEDNVWFFSFRIPELTHVLLVGSQVEDIRPLKMALYYQKTEQPVFQVYEVLYHESWIDRLNEADVVYLSNIPFLKSAEADRLSQFIKAGGGLFFLMGDAMDLRLTSQMFFESAMGISLGNGEGNTHDPSGYMSFGNIDYGHPIFRGMFEKGSENILSPRFYRVVDLIGNIPMRIITLRNGKPFLIEAKLGKGSLLLAASGIGDDWSDWIYSSIFSPLIYRSAAYLSNRSNEYENVKIVGESVFLSTDIEDMDDSYSVMTPDGDEFTVIPDIEHGEAVLTFQGADKPGVYSFFRGESLIGMQTVNRDPQESDFKILTESELKEMLPKSRIHVVNDMEMIEKIVTETRWGRELWRELLLLGIMVLIVEMAVARESQKL